MSGPNGSVTKRDQRRDQRRAQLQQQQAARRAARARAIRQQRIQRAAIIAIGVLVFALIAFFVVHAVAGQPAGLTTPTLSAQTPGEPMRLDSAGKPANGQTIDGLKCAPETLAVHYHVYLEMFADGKQVSLTPGAGIVAPKSTSPNAAPALGANGNTTCLYPLHVHASDNVIHVELDSNRQVTLGSFFDIFGQPLSTTKFAGYTADAGHKLEYRVLDATGNVKQVTGDPREIVLADHETIAVLYNSPNIAPAVFTDWQHTTAGG